VPFADQVDERLIRLGFAEDLLRALLCRAQRQSRERTEDETPHDLFPRAASEFHFSALLQNLLISGSGRVRRHELRMP